MSIDERVLAIILAGGRGTRLFNLTKETAKPAITFAGYKLVDIMLSNLFNSEMKIIHLLTEYKSGELDDHIPKWDQRTGMDGSVVNVPFQMRAQDHPSRGSGDSLYNHMFNRIKLRRRRNIQHYAILNGDTVSDSLPRHMYEHHLSTGAHITLEVYKVPVDVARLELGVVVVDKAGNVLGFQEKPEHPIEIPGEPGMCLANMANYIVDSTLFDDAVDEFLPDESKGRYDLSKDIITPLVEQRKERKLKINASVHDGFWADVGTLKSLFNANMNLLSLNPRFNIYNQDNWYRTFVDKFGGQGAKITELAGETKPIIANAGSIISGTARWCVLSYGVILEVGSVSDRVVYADLCKINRNARVMNSILDKECEVGSGAVINPNDVDVWLADDRIEGRNRNGYNVKDLGRGHILLQKSNDGRNIDDIVDRHGNGILDSSGFVKELYMEENKDKPSSILEFVLTPPNGEGRIATFSKFSRIPDGYHL